LLFTATTLFVPFKASLACCNALRDSISFSLAFNNKFAFSEGEVAVADLAINALASLFKLSDEVFKSCACLLVGFLKEGFLESLSPCKFQFILIGFT
jgi:hypothetical protein